MNNTQPTVTEAFGATVMTKREWLGLSQQQCAERCGLSRVTINRLELGKVKVSLEHAVQVAKVLDLSLDGLL